MRIERAAPEEAGVTSPRPEPLRAPTAARERPEVLRFNANAPAGGEARP